MEIYVDDETKLTSRSCTGIFDAFFFLLLQYFCFISWLSLAHSTNAHFHCLSVQHYILLKEAEKNCNWMTLTHWTSIRLSFLSRVWLELLSWTSYLLSVTKAAELNKLLCSWFLLLFFIFLLYGENTYMAEFFALSS